MSRTATNQAACDTSVIAVAREVSRLNAHQPSKKCCFYRCFVAAHEHPHKCLARGLRRRCRTMRARSNTRPGLETRLRVPALASSCTLRACEVAQGFSPMERCAPRFERLLPNGIAATYVVAFGRKET